MISEAEAEIMKVLWGSDAALPTEEICLALETDWQVGTIKTLINRLLSKGAISAEKDGRRFLYSAILTRDEYVAHQSRSFLDRMMDGSLAPIMAHFSKHKALSKAEQKALKNLLQELGNSDAS